MKYNNKKKKMSLSEKIKLYKEMKEELVEKGAQLTDINSEISSKKEELDCLKKESLELKDFINGKFNSEFNENYDYKVNIKNCYVISLNGKKYISVRDVYKKNIEYIPYFGSVFIYDYEYFDTLSVILKDGKKRFELLCDYREDNFFNKCAGTKPESEEHILRLCPELKMYADGKVPNTHLKKIYYEINDLAKLTPSSEQNVSKIKKLN